jgi:hypothetical protein
MANRRPIQVGGSFAPPLTDESLAAYRQLADAAPAQVRDAMAALLGCVGKWWELPESGGASAPHPSGAGRVIELSDDVAAALDAHIPWREELSMFAGLFDSIDPVKDAALRNAAHHLLWFANELELGREPMTSDKL